jgi:formylglycine-generating enzyme required for sulfatase activity
MFGNVGEWCHPLEPIIDNVAQADDKKRQFLHRGGSYQDDARAASSAFRVRQTETGYSFTGFRLARTIEPASDGQTTLKKAVTPE